MADDPTWYFGVVKAILPEKGFGFVQCDESYAHYGADVYLHSTQIEGLEQGTQICFQVKLNAKGKPQAVDVSLSDGGQVGGGVKQASGTSSFQAWEQPWAQQNGGKGGKGKGKTSWGVFPPQRGQHVAPPSAPNTVGDSWLQAVLDRGTRGGTPLVLDAIVESTGDHAGVVSAVKLWLAANASHAASPSFQTSYSSAVRPKLVLPRSTPYGAGKGNGASQSVDAAFEAALAAMPAEGENGETRFEGLVTAIKHATAEGRPAMGFVKCDETKQLYGDDVFLHSSQAEELQVGQRISFAVQVNKSGRPQAINVMLVE